MPVYSQSKADDDGRGLARELAALRQGLRAVRRRTAAGNIPDPTPPPTEALPGTIAAATILGRTSP